jgi:phosphatidylserine decarboxylase
MIARTIIPFLKQQTRVEKGEELGMIKFGSRVDLIVPIQEKMKILIKQGQYVYGGQTPLIRIDK